MYYLMKYDHFTGGNYLLIMDDSVDYKYSSYIISGIVHAIYTQQSNNDEPLVVVYKEGTVGRFIKEAIIAKDKDLNKLKELAMLEVL